MRVGVILSGCGFKDGAEIQESVLTLPERVVFFSGDSTWVEVSGSDGTRVKVLIETGLSDAIRIEVKSGVEEGQEILEKEQKKI